MFDIIKQKLTALEARLKGITGELKAEVARVEAEIKGLDRTLLMPLDKVNAEVKKTEASVGALIAPLKQQVASLKPPAG